MDHTMKQSSGCCILFQVPNFTIVTMGKHNNGSFYSKCLIQVIYSNIFLQIKQSSIVLFFLLFFHDPVSKCLPFDRDSGLSLHYFLDSKQELFTCCTNITFVILNPNIQRFAPLQNE